MSEGDGEALRVVVRPRARRDIAEILGFTERRWGKGQRAAYRAILQGGIDEIGRYPERGRVREEVFAGCRTLLTGTHVIYYRVTSDRVLVMRVLHTSQNVTDETEF